MNENEIMEQVQETTPEIVIDYKSEFKRLNETVKQLQTDIVMERHHVLPEHRKLISETFNKLSDESTDETKAFELMQRMYPEAFRPKVPEFSVPNSGPAETKEKSSFLAGLTGKIPL